MTGRRSRFTIPRATRRHLASWLLQGLELVLLVLGVAGLGWYGWTTVRIHRLQSEAHITVERMLAGPKSGAPVVTPISPETGLIGQLDIPRLKVSAVVFEGDDEAVLGFAVGHVPETPQPWQPGNSAFAAHRDGLFRPLRRIRVGDDIRLATRFGTLQYRVRRTFVVNPDDVWVLDPLPQVSLTLITCFPFYYVGHAPQRFIVQAERVEPLAP